MDIEKSRSGRSTILISWGVAFPILFLSTLAGCCSQERHGETAGPGWVHHVVLSFENKEALGKYLVHPDHLKAVKEVLGPRVKKILVYDFTQE
ncbi:MAG: Dabb family protein [Planctomycetota bacterium]|jgi:hypothetical protein